MPFPTYLVYRNYVVFQKLTCKKGGHSMWLNVELRCTFRFHIIDSLRFATPGTASALCHFSVDGFTGKILSPWVFESE